MSLYMADDFDYTTEEDEDMANVGGDITDEDNFYGSDGEAIFDDDDLPSKKRGTSAAQARRGRDIQGIPWRRLNITRDNYRKTRLEHYKNYENVSSSGELIDKKYKQMEKGGNYYEFHHNTRLVNPTVLHFQLRNLVWATSKHDVYLMSHYSVMHWSSLSHKLSKILDFQGHVAPVEKHPGSLIEGFTQTQISTLAVKENLMVAGGFLGELTCKRLDRKGVSFCSRMTYDENSITNSIDIFNTLSGGVHFVASNNDSGIREYDVETFQLLNHFRFPWPVNVSCLIQFFQAYIYLVISCLRFAQNQWLSLLVVC
ncbi:hypothetical protein AQUCO_10800018v1 [Aquilegia coerulea]|uniref:Transducin/WD40 repeat-like superfamily protein n=1 Tax=Aquilegia coerulea TaxID=218851 RepID=A0A2G5C372_AQUCA|nr:hypothetical protein AQUCO_10800018v1 [Aquilegia coerulea]